MEMERPVNDSVVSEYSEYDQTTDNSANQPSFDVTVTDSEPGTPPIFRAATQVDEDFPEQEDFRIDATASSPVKRDAPDNFDGEEDDHGEHGEDETLPEADESWHPISDKEAKEEAKRAKKAEKDEKARLAKLAKEEKARLAKEEKEEKARLAKEAKERAKEEKLKAQQEKKETGERDKMERQSKREKSPKEKAPKEKAPKEKAPKEKKEKERKERPPPRPQVRNPRMMLARVAMLDGEVLEIEIEKIARGQVLHDVICENQNLEERDYFGLTHNFDRMWFWLDPEKKISHQVKKNDWDFEFRVKFYAPEPMVMKIDITRYFLCQQIRNDINIGKLPCSMLTAAILGSYTVQSELGDYDPETAQGLQYMNDYQFVPNQTPELLMRIADLHKVHRGQTPADADVHFLENAMKLAMYGVDLHQVWDSENVELMLGICWAGVNVYKDKLRINRFPWPKILKISYKKNRFFLRIRPGEFEHFENTIGFKCRNHVMAKRLWKCAVEQHTFFRKKEPEVRFKHLLPRFGSKFRYSGRTIHQSRTANIHNPCPAVDRSFTLRKSRSMNMGGYGGTYQSLQRDARLNQSDAGYSPGHYRQASGSSEHLNLNPRTLEEVPNEQDVADGHPAHVELNVADGPQPYTVYDDAPRAYIEHNDVPRAYIEHDDVPRAYIEHDDPPRAYIEHDDAPRAYIEHDNAPRAYIEHDDTPRAYIEQEDDVPRAYIEHDDRPQGYIKQEVVYRQPAYTQPEEPVVYEHQTYIEQEVPGHQGYVLQETHGQQRYQHDDAYGQQGYGQHVTYTHQTYIQQPHQVNEEQSERGEEELVMSLPDPPKFELQTGEAPRYEAEMHVARPRTPTLEIRPAAAPVLESDML